MALVIRPEENIDLASIRDVLRRGFGRDDEAQLVDALRDGGFTRISLVAELDGAVIGQILFSALSISTPTGNIPALSLAPMVVVPAFQRQGIGSELVRRGLEHCRERRERIVIVLGHPEYYPRFGFSVELARRLESPYAGGDSWMALELVPGALAGIAGRVEYPPPFAAL